MNTPTADSSFARKDRTGSGWLLAAALIALVAIPVAAGIGRLAELARGAVVTPENARFFAAPAPVVVHISSACLFCVLGAFQFVPGLRRRRPGLHRVMGRLLVICGVFAGLSGLWLTLFYPHVEGDGPLLFGLRLVFGSGLVGCMALGFAAIRRRDIAQHRAWITRGYAIGMGAGTQALVHLIWIPILGTPGELARALLLGAGWIINLSVAEWSIRKDAPRARAAQPAIA
jgi:uncharacterized membrane protein